MARTTMAMATARTRIRMAATAGRRTRTRRTRTPATAAAATAAMAMRTAAAAAGTGTRTALRRAPTPGCVRWTSWRPGCPMLGVVAMALSATASGCLASLNVLQVGSNRVLAMTWGAERCAGRRGGGPRGCRWYAGRSGRQEHQPAVSLLAGRPALPGRALPQSEHRRCRRCVSEAARVRVCGHAYRACRAWASRWLEAPERMYSVCAAECSNWGRAAGAPCCTWRVTWCRAWAWRWRGR